jgi:hypothetical protein
LLAFRNVLRPTVGVRLLGVVHMLSELTPERSALQYIETLLRDLIAAPSDLLLNGLIIYRFGPPDAALLAALEAWNLKQFFSKKFSSFVGGRQLHGGIQRGSSQQSRAQRAAHFCRFRRHRRHGRSVGAHGAGAIS